MTRLRAIVTNDDGIDSEGIRTLARVAVEAGLDVTVAAPLHESSGASASLTAVEDHGRVAMARRTMEGLEDVPAFGVRAVPGFIAWLATREAFGPRPDVVLSGVNHGPNLGHAILHSGTVGAALTAATHGCRAMAVSMAAADPSQWETAAIVARAMVPVVIDHAGPTAVLNVNVPDVPPSELRGIRRAGLARFGAVQANVAEVAEGFVKVTFGDVDAECEEGTDAALIADGYATVTPLNPICEARGVDLPDLDLALR